MRKTIILFLASLLAYSSLSYATIVQIGYRVPLASSFFIQPFTPGGQQCNAHVNGGSIWGYNNVISSTFSTISYPTSATCPGNAANAISWTISPSNNICVYPTGGNLANATAVVGSGQPAINYLVNGIAVYSISGNPPCSSITTSEGESVPFVRCGRDTFDPTTMICCYRTPDDNSSCSID